MNTVRKILRREFKAAPQLNSDILRRALPSFKSQTDMRRVFDAPTTQQREWIMSREQGAPSRGAKSMKMGKCCRRTRSVACCMSRCAATARCCASWSGSKVRESCCTKTSTRLASVDITTLRLAGFRRREYTHLQCSGLKIDKPESMDRRTHTTYIDVIGKGRRPRKVSMTGYTEIGIELAREQVRGRAADEYVSEFNYNALVRVLGELVKLGAPAAAPKDFRSTGCNYAQRLLHIQEGTRAGRWGHGIQTHRSYYLLLTGSALTPCATLEESMGCMHLMKRALRLRTSH